MGDTTQLATYILSHLGNFFTVFSHNSELPVIAELVIVSLSNAENPAIHKATPQPYHNSSNLSKSF